jgi:hypothetical protein
MSLTVDPASLSGGSTCGGAAKPVSCSILPGDTFTLQLQTNNAPNGVTSGFYSEILPDGLLYKTRPCANESPASNDVVCVKSIGGAGEIRHYVNCCVIPPAAQLDSVITPGGEHHSLLELHMNCPAPGSSTVTLTSYPASPDGASYENENLIRIGVKSDPADTLTINCIDPAADTDQDGCNDVEELGPNEAMGGRRDYTIFWDFFDTPDPSNVRDKAVATADFFRVLARFGATGNPAIDPLSMPPPSGYHTAFDRGPASGDPWDLTAPNGSIAAADYFATLQQFGHTCTAAPN